MATPIVAPYVPTYAATEPYITPAEFKAGATGVTTSNLVPAGDAAAQADALAQKIIAASGWADVICNQVLACTTEVLAGVYRVRDGQVLIPLTQTPIVQLNAASFGVNSELTPLTSFTGVMFPSPAVVSIPYSGVADRVNAQIEYLAGYANTRTTAAANAGVTVLTVGDTLGMVPGLRLTIADPGKAEIVTVASVTDTTVTLTAATLFQHAIGTSVSALPPAVKQAVIFLTAVLIKSRGSDAVVLSSMQGGQSKQQVDPDSAGLLQQAMDLLLNYRRVTLG